MEPSIQNVFNMSWEDGDAIMKEARVAVVVMLSGNIDHRLAVRACFVKEDNVS